MLGRTKTYNHLVQAAIRAFAVDCAPSHQQEAANAWISRTIGVGNIVGMFAGGLNLPRLLPWLGDTQFKVLCALAAISLFVTVGISAVSVSERDPRTEAEHPNSHDSMTQLAKSLWRSLFHLPPQISQVCKVQFLAWMGWFPFLFYTTTYIGEIYVEPFFEANPHMSPKEVDELWDRGTRRGTVALLAFSIVTFTSSILLPFIVVPTYEPPKTNQQPGTLLTPHSSNDMSSSGQLSKSRRGALGNLQHSVSTAISFALKKIQIKSLTLRRTWLLSHLLFAGCMWMTFFVRGTTLATVLVGLVGIPWSVTMWAPFALISSEISKRDAIRRGLIRPPPTREGQLLAAGEDDSADQAGVVLGIHNVSISAPQVIATVVGSILFKFLQKPRGTPGDSSVAWFFRLAGLCAVAAAYLTTKVNDDRQDVEYEYEERPRTAGTI
jgi:solute carrier family 45 protein 1/2/4